MKTTQKLKVAPDGIEANLTYKHDGPAIRDRGDIDLVCGKCERVIYEGYVPDRKGKTFMGLSVSVKCATCGAVNEMPSDRRKRPAA